MGRDNTEHMVTNLLKQADILIDGNRPWDITVHNPLFFRKVLAEGSLGFGETYMAGWWDCKALDQCITNILKAKLDDAVRGSLKNALQVLKAKMINLQRPSRAFEIGKRHYDIGNDLYKHMLDSRMVYSCGYWKDASTLDEAQYAKLDLICKKIGLKTGMRILDIGCGWGSFAKFAAENYGAEVVGITVSKEQMKIAQEMCNGLPVEIRLQDYRKLRDTFDRIVSIGMFEHVGYKNYAAYMDVVHRCLKPDGLFLLHTIGGNRSVHMTDPWIEKYIFPNSMLPSAKQITSAAEGLFVLEDWHNFGSDYDKTLMAWHKHFVDNWNEIKKQYDDKFYRMWIFYLLSCAASFRSTNNQLWQIVFSRSGVPEGYKPVR